MLVLLFAAAPTQPHPRPSLCAPAKLVGSVFVSAAAARLGRDLQLDYQHASIIHVSLLAFLGALGAYLAHSFGTSRTSLWVTLVAASVGAAVGASLDGQGSQFGPIRGALEGLFVGLADVFAESPVRQPLLSMAATVGGILPAWTILFTSLAASIAAAASSRRAPLGEAIGPLGIPKHGWRRCCGIALVQGIAICTVGFATIQHVPAGPKVPSCARSPGTRVGDVFAGCGFGSNAFEHWGTQSNFEWEWRYHQDSTASSWARGWRTAAHYQALGLQPGATQNDIRSAFLKRSVETHPDKNPGQQEAFLRVREAYDALKT